MCVCVRVFVLNKDGAKRKTASKNTRGVAGCGQYRLCQEKIQEVISDIVQQVVLQDRYTLSLSMDSLVL